MFITKLYLTASILNPDFLIFFFFGALFVLTLFLVKVPRASLGVLILGLLEASFVWKLLVEIWMPVSHVVSEANLVWSLLFVNHRWLVLLPVPFLLAAAIIVLGVYKEKIADIHAKEYRRCFSLLVFSSFILFVFSFIESFF
jgi:hypothetical protein